ncbi:hypothetical protein [Oceanicella actignis]|uniref:hypothetical protein n=1 Tax=Oceanicella actignis TaxID=1189325 RepID=UPI0011E70AE3|nr:hypothetical protein [Oceanicella actignis]TYO88905.1 hypothetical protein LY05_02060 [Oceanicella actignis]
MTPMALMRAAALALLAASGAAADQPAGQDKYAGYHYPPVGSQEVFARDLIRGPAPDAAAREAFVSMIAAAQFDGRHPAGYALFAKGAGSRKLIMVALDDQIFRTPFRARAVMARLSAAMRGAPFFKENGLSQDGTFFDMLAMLDFESLTVTDGATWSHRVIFDRRAE